MPTWNGTAKIVGEAEVDIPAATVLGWETWKLLLDFEP